MSQRERLLTRSSECSMSTDLKLLHDQGRSTNRKVVPISAPVTQAKTESAVLALFLNTVGDTVRGENL
jgi:hypothetical protein